MKKEDFRYEYPEMYLKDVYVYECDEYLLTIEKDIFDDETIAYANNIADKYLKNKDELLDEMLNRGLREFYKEVYDYSDKFIKENIGRPQIRILSKNNGNKDLKYHYLGTLTYLESKLDEHIIEIEFADDFRLARDVQMDG